MIQRIVNRYRREIRKKSRRDVPFQAQMTYQESGNQWYEPLLAGPSTLIGPCTSADSVRGALGVLDKLSPDRYLEFVRNFYRRGLDSFGENWVYADINTVLYGIAKTLKIGAYLEIGVRRGRSMSMVASMSPQARIAGFDLWIQGYAGMDNPGKDFVKSELAKLGHNGPCEFIDGDSKVTVPRYFRENPGAYFDLITVDGDHSRAGAAADIDNVIPRLKVGGVLVFDDICNPEHSYLQELWDRKVNRRNGFLTHSFAETGFGVAFAIRDW